MSVVLKATAEKSDWIARCLKDSQNDGDMPSLTLSRLKRDGANAFQKLGFPTSALEDWKYTNLAHLSRDLSFALPSNAKKTNIKNSVAANFPSELLCSFVNGVSQQMPSVDFPGLQICRLADVFGADRSSISAELQTRINSTLGSLIPLDQFALPALNTALLQDGVVVWVGKNIKVDKPIHIQFSIVDETESLITAPRVLVIADEGSQVTVLESFVGEGARANLTIPVTEVVVEANAAVSHIKYQAESQSGIHISNLHVQLQNDSRFYSHVLQFGGLLVRSEIHPALLGTGIECYLNGFTVIGGEQHVDNFTVLDHAKPNCFSRELYKGIYADRSTGAFSGTIIVKQDAQKTNAIQSNQSILLSDTASVQTRPQLKIWADDVKCTHGATVGQLDENALFYLRSRGIGRLDAQRLLLQAFASELLNEVPVTSVLKASEDVLRSRIN